MTKAPTLKEAKALLVVRVKSIGYETFKEKINAIRAEYGTAPNWNEIKEETHENF